MQKANNAEYKIEELIENMLGKLGIGIGAASAGAMLGDHFDDNIEDLGKNIGRGAEAVTQTGEKILHGYSPDRDMPFYATDHPTWAGKTGDFMHRYAPALGAGVGVAAGHALSRAAYGKENRSY